MVNIILTEQESYEAMYAYLFKIYEITKSDELGGLLGSMSTLPDGRVADPAIWNEWLQCIDDVKQGKVNTSLFE